MKFRWKHEVKIFACTAGGFVGVLLAVVAHYGVWIKIPPLGNHLLFLGTALLLGFPTFGGAPFEIHFFNAAVWMLWGAIAYGALFQMLFRRVRIRKVVVLYAACMAAIAVGGLLASKAVIAPALTSEVLPIVFTLASIFFVRDWPARA